MIPDACVLDLVYRPAAHTFDALDNAQCGGMNVRFTGTWSRFTPKAAPEVRRANPHTSSSHKLTRKIDPKIDRAAAGDESLILGGSRHLRPNTRKLEEPL